MSIFIPPKGSREQLSSLVLLEGELVYDTTNKSFYTGDNITSGGVPIVNTTLEEISSMIDNATAQYVSKEEIPSIENLATTGYVDTAISNAVENLVNTDSLSSYAKKDELNSLISEEVDPIFATASAQFAIKKSEEYGNQPASGFTSHQVDGKTVYEAIEGETINLSGDVLILKGNNFLSNRNIPHSIISKLTNYSLEITAEKTEANPDGNVSTSQLNTNEAQQAISDKLFTVNIGSKNIVSGMAAMAIGKGNRAIGAYSFAHGYGTFANSAAAHAEGHNNNANGGYSHAEGQSTVADGSYAHAEGCGVHANGQWSHAEGGEGAETNGSKSHAEGRGKTFGDFSHAEGMYAVASGVCAHAEGNSCQAIGEVSHAEGYSTNVSGIGAHGEGKTTWTGGNYAHAEGEATHADFECSHAEGCYMNTAEAHQHVEGKYGVSATGYQHIVGGGTENARKNIQTLDWDGNQVNAGNMTAADFFLAGDAESVATKLNAILERLAALENKNS